MDIPVTLAAVAAAALINIWHIVRVGKTRVAEKIMHGDGGNPRLMRRMRAQLNYAENTPLVLLLIVALELSGHGGTWLAAVAAIYLLARVSHAIGMDREDVNAMRAAGIAVTLLSLIGLAAMALLVVTGVL